MNKEKKEPQVTTAIPISMRDRLKIMCATNKIPIKSFIVEAIKEKMERENETKNTTQTR